MSPERPGDQLRLAPGLRAIRRGRKNNNCAQFWIRRAGAENQAALRHREVLRRFLGRFHWEVGLTG
eukprot:289331-Pyramimonas_sp.AAC.1